MLKALLVPGDRSQVSAIFHLAGRTVRYRAVTVTPSRRDHDAIWASILLGPPAAAAVAAAT